MTRCAGGFASCVRPIGPRAHSTARGSPMALSVHTAESARGGGAGADGVHGALHWQSSERSRGRGAARPRQHFGSAAALGSSSDYGTCTFVWTRAPGVCPTRVHGKWSRRLGERGERGALPSAPNVCDDGGSLRSQPQCALARCMQASERGWSLLPRAAPHSSFLEGLETLLTIGQRGGTLRWRLWHCKHGSTRGRRGATWRAC